VTRPQSVLDALADAETLRLNVGLADMSKAASWMLYHPLSVGYPAYPAEAFRTSAIFDARAAFRAVPALRAAQQEGQ
jgi:hypothetical protein